MDEKTRESNRLRQRKFLELHKEEVNEKRRDKYHERISSGKCPRCGSKTKKGRTLCTDCCDYMLNLNRKYAKQNKAAVKTKAPVKKVKKAAPAKTKKVVKVKKAPKKKTR
jgi:hypothetical protein